MPKGDVTEEARIVADPVSEPPPAPISNTSENHPEPKFVRLPDPREIEALRSFYLFTIMNIESGHLTLSANMSMAEGTERYRKWKDLKNRVNALIKTS
jgi:hypothetical protein